MKKNTLRISHFLALLCVSYFSYSTAHAAPPLVNLSNTPLYTGSQNLHPNLLLSLSVEFPTIGAAYPNTYDNNQDYLGYFNNKKCYIYPGGTASYKDQNSKGPYTFQTPELAAKGEDFFSISKDQNSARTCDGDSFSGNFLNWASSSAIDMLRLALTGGDRISDTSDQTVLQRAFLYKDFYASYYFPRRTISNATAVTPFGKSTIYAVNCDDKILFSDEIANTACSTNRMAPKKNTLAKTDKVLGEYFVRVKVCDSKDATSRSDLCQRYPNGNFKPVGQMQKNANIMRFGVMGYLMDNTNTRYGGVLRAPMKYLGTKMYSAPDFLENTNSRPEWDSQSGVFLTNPEGNTAQANSGVINYLNKFGRTGNYKSFDPVSELYYESIRYLQGQQPTSEAFKPAPTTAMYDDFPALSSWEDPITASCQRNYILTIADANTHQDKFVPGNTRTSTADKSRNADADSSKWPAFNVMTWTDKVAKLEADAGGLFGNSAPRSNLSNMAAADTGSSGGTYYIAGTAYWANTTPIRKDKPVQVKTFVVDVDEGGNGTLDNSPRATKPRDSQLYLAAKYGGFADKNLDGNPFKSIGTDSSASAKSNLEWDSDNDGVPDNYFLSSQPEKMMAAINKIFQTVATSTGTMAGVGISATSAEQNPFVYQPGFDASRWSGNLTKSSALNPNNKVWDAGQILTGNQQTNVAPQPAANARKIYTAQISSTGNLRTVDFIWNGGNIFADSIQTKFNTDPISGKQDNLGEARINYLRGDRSLEFGNGAGTFRTRDSVLGDIVNSTPVFYGAAAKNINGSGYQTFYDLHKNRQKVVYVGANDGMLHAFNADNGNELFAYVPNILHSELPSLTSQNYTHKAYVDGTINITEARIKNEWATILTAGLGSGARGVFALDVTDPVNFLNGKKVLFEFTSNDDADVGFILSAPQIARFRTSALKDSPVYSDFVVFSSGYNNGSGNGTLFLLSLDKSPSSSWTLGENYFKITTTADQTIQNGLAAPAFVVGANGTVSYAYAGDLQGNLWRFDFTLLAPGAIKPLTKPLFKAKTGSGRIQAITTKPNVVFALGGGYLVLFGTGRYLETSDLIATNFDDNTFYAILDRDGSSVERNKLQPRTVTIKDSGYIVSGDNFDYGTKPEQKRGWYLDFPGGKNSGERSVTNPAYAGGQIYFNSLLLSSNSCSNGSGRKYSLNVLTGKSNAVTGLRSTIGMLGTPVIINSNTAIGDRSNSGAKRVTTTSSVRQSGTGGEDGNSQTDTAIPPSTRAGRISWLEIQNWQELHKKVKE